ncbi:MAG TPA: DUF6438 domain-containing protein [Longimicrobiales bacterium]
MIRNLSYSRLAACAAVAVIALPGCMSAGNGTNAEDAPAVRMEDVLITIERTPCFGTCPVYTLSLTGEGVVTFNGTRFTRVTGLAVDTVAADSVAVLLDEIQAAGYFTMKENYTPSQPDACGMYHTDAPSVTTAVKTNTQSKQIVNYHGCNGAPAALRAVEDAIDRVANTKQWLNQN